jgi:hypothetical protein
MMKPLISDSDIGRNVQGFVITRLLHNGVLLECAKCKTRVKRRRDTVRDAIDERQWLEPCAECEKTITSLEVQARDFARRKAARIQKMGDKPYTLCGDRCAVCQDLPHARPKGGTCRNCGEPYVAEVLELAPDSRPRAMTDFA